jgi:hypothetical protein
VRAGDLANRHAKDELMIARNLWSRVLVIVGGIAMLFGAIDPLEGSLVILPGSLLVLLGIFIGPDDRRSLRYWIATVLLIASGVIGMFVLSAFGGIGGESGHSMWWGVLVLPYPLGWIMGIGGLAFRLLRRSRHHRAAA